ncbi:MAG: HlyC/CorC family transporter [Gemmatimonadales bacterium]|nr:MAG: HlyC/CorC family transporter [Gemmatimonadales bacterium]
MSGLLLALAALFLILSALLSAAESAVFSVSASRLRTLLEEGFRGAETLRRARDVEGGMKASMFTLNVTLNAAVAGLVCAWAVLFLNPMAITWVLPLVVLGLLIISEGVPRLLATRRSIRLALLTAPLLLFLERLTRPLIEPFIRFDDLLQRRNGDGLSSADERELRQLTDLGRREGVVEEEEHQLVERAFRMDEMTAYDIMTPRVDIFGWPDSLTLAEIVPQIRNVPYSRVPVYGDGIDDITGILYIREAYEAFSSGRQDLPLSKLSRDPFFIPGSLTLPRLLKDFQARRIHMGIVADEFGGTDGLVTLEDVIEELVGEIEDETDIAEESFVRISRNEIDVEGGIELREVNYVFNVSLPHLEHRSLNGYLLEEFGHVPAEGERLSIPGIEIEIIEATETQVLRARLTKTHPTTADELEEVE